VHGLVGGDVHPANTGVEGVQIAVDQADIEFQLEVARGAHRPVVGQADLAAHADVQLQGHDSVLLRDGKGAGRREIP
jgi:hypothetical protein